MRLSYHSCPKTALPDGRGMGVIFQKREGPGKGCAERGSQGGQRPSSIHSMEGIPWRFPGGHPPASPIALRSVPGTGFLVFEKRPPCPCKCDPKKSEPESSTNSRLVQKQGVTWSKSSFQTYLGQHCFHVIPEMSNFAESTGTPGGSLKGVIQWVGTTGINK